MLKPSQIKRIKNEHDRKYWESIREEWETVYSFVYSDPELRKLRLRGDEIFPLWMEYLRTVHKNISGVLSLPKHRKEYEKPFVKWLKTPPCLRNRPQGPENCSYSKYEEVDQKAELAMKGIK